MTTKISVALCTYNGARYLPAQLQSMLHQSRLPDEVVVRDDGSSDTTKELIEAFRATAPFPVHILQRDERLGSTKNFERVLRHCTGDLIALSDQDDRWKPQRLARSLELMEQRPAATLLFANGDLIDEQDHPMPGSLWQRFGFAGEPLRRFTEGDYGMLCRERCITGATVMLRRDTLTQALPIPEGWMHDAWLGIVLSFHGELIALDEPLIEYRLHTQQQVGAVTSRWQVRATREAAAHWRRIREEHLQAETLDAHLRQHPPAVRAELQPLYQARLDFLRFRDALPQPRIARIVPVLRHWNDYQTHAGGAGSTMKDWLFRRNPSPGNDVQLKIP
jgi:hypothetical protein